jgi:hypothetical protein
VVRSDVVVFFGCYLDSKKKSTEKNSGFLIKQHVQLNLLHSENPNLPSAITLKPYVAGGVRGVRWCGWCTA